jgi:hypothetical protein
MFDRHYLKSEFPKLRAAHSRLATCARVVSEHTDGLQRSQRRTMQSENATRLGAMPPLALMIF